MRHKHQRSKKNETEKLTIWEKIIDNNSTMKKCYDEMELKRKTFGHVTIESPSGYLNRVLFPILLPALEETLYEARRRKLLKKQSFCIFNGLDYLVEVLWNNNTMHPERSDKWVKLFEMEWALQHCSEKPRTIYPLSWLLTDEEAAIIIQSYFRGYCVRKVDDVQEMRIFWRIIKEENLQKQILANQNSEQI